MRACLSVCHGFPTSHRCCYGEYDNNRGGSKHALSEPSGCQHDRQQNCNISETVKMMASSRDPHPFPRLQNDDDFVGSRSKQVNWQRDCICDNLVTISGPLYMCCHYTSNFGPFPPWILWKAYDTVSGNEWHTNVYVYIALIMTTHWLTGPGRWVNHFNSLWPGDAICYGDIELGQHWLR